MKRGKKYQDAVKAYDRSAQYDVAEAIDLVKKNATAKFDETIELHLRTGCDGRHAEQQIRGAVVLPHGTGKTVKVLVFAKGTKVDEAQAAGAESEEQIEKQIVLQIQQLKKTGDMEKLFHGSWSHMDAFDEDEWLEHLEEHLKEIVNISGKDEKTIAERFEKHREEIHRRIRDEHPEMAERFKERRHVLDEHLKEKHPEVFKLIENLRENQN